MDYNEQQRIKEMRAQELAGRDDAEILRQNILAEEQRQMQQEQFAEEQQQQEIQMQPEQQIVSESSPEQAQQQETEGLQAVEGSPFRKEDGSLDWDKVEQTGREFDMDTLAGLADFAVDSINFVANRFGANDPVPKLPKFENELAQSSREIQSLLLPMLAGNAAAMGGIQKIDAVQKSKFLTSAGVKFVGTKALETGVGATVGAISATSKEDNASGTLKQNFPRTWGWLPDWVATNDRDSPDDKWRKNIVEGVLFDSGLSMVDGAFALTRKSSANGQTFNWIPENEKGKAYQDANLPKASPEDAKAYYQDIKSDEYFAENPEADFEEAFASIGKEWDKLKDSEKQQWRVIANNNDPDLASTATSKAQQDALDEIGQYNLTRNVRQVEVEVPMDSRELFVNKGIEANQEAIDGGIVTADEVAEELSRRFDELDDATRAAWDQDVLTTSPMRTEMRSELNLDEPIFGVHDLYGYRESGVRQVDDMGIVGASVDAARIQGNIDTINGRLGSMISDSAIKLSNQSDQLMIDDINRGLAEELKAAGQYGYVTNTGKKIEFEQIQSAGDILASKLYQKSPEEMSEMLAPFLGGMTKQGARALNTEGGKAIESVMSRYYKEMLDPDLLRAQGLLSTSLAGQAADTAMGVRLMDGTEALERGTEQVLDRLEYLMQMKAQTDFVRDSAVQLGNLRKQLNTFGPQAKINKELKRSLQRWEEVRLAGEEALPKIKAQASQTIETMRAISKEQPELMAPFLFAYEMTDGALNSMTALNRYYNESTAVWRKAFIDGRSDIPSIYNKAWWSNVYNTMLGAPSTLVNAGKSMLATGLARPIADGAGALINRDQRAIRRGWYMYSGMMDTLSNSTDYMKKVWKKAGTDPSLPGQRVDSQTQDATQIEIIRRMAAAKAKQGEPAAQIFVDQMNNMIDIANDPNLRFGPRGLSALDGFMEAVVGNWEARGRAWTALTNNGATDIKPEQMDALAKDIYSQMFDETGMMTDEAVKYASGELSFNLDSGFNQGLNTLIEQVPLLKGFTMFNKTLVSSAAFSASSNPIGAFYGKLSKFSAPFEDMPSAKVEELLTERGVKFDNTTIKDEYSRIRNELRGRKAIGATAVALGGALFMNDRLRGDGLYDAQAQATRRELGWEKRTYKGWDGKWYSYDGLGAISDYVALIANLMDNGLFWANGKAALRNQEMEEHLRAAEIVLSSALTDRLYYANLEPLFDILRGNPAALNRWLGSFLPSATVPGSNAMMQFNELLNPAKVIVEQSWLDIAASRTPMKAAMPKRYGWVEGNVVGEPDNFWQRIWNASRVWKQSGPLSEDEQFLVDVGFDARPSVQSNGKGVIYSTDEQEEILSHMGKQGYFKARIQEIRKFVDSEEYRREFRRAQAEGLNPNVETFMGVNKKLRKALNESMELAYRDLSTKGEVTTKQYSQDLMKQRLEAGDIEGAKEIQDFYKK